MKLCTSLALSRRAEVVLARLRVGNATTRHKLFQAGLVDSPACHTCTVCPTDTASHRILECSAYNIQRAQLRTVVEQEVPNASFTLATLIGLADVPHKSQPEVLKGFATFLKDTDLLNLFVWRKPDLAEPE